MIDDTERSQPDPSPDSLPESLQESSPEAYSSKLPRGLMALQREAVTPREQHRSVGTVALLCSLAGVASGFALAATVVVSQLSSPAARGHNSCRRVVTPAVSPTVGFLGITYVNLPDGAALVRNVYQGAPADALGLKPGDVVRAVGTEIIDAPGELQYLVRTAGPDALLPLTVERDGGAMTLTATLGSLRVGPAYR